jgi:hypothetical protein
VLIKHLLVTIQQRPWPGKSLFWNKLQRAIIPSGDGQNLPDNKKKEHTS